MHCEYCLKQNSRTGTTEQPSECVVQIVTIKSVGRGREIVAQVAVVASIAVAVQETEALVEVTLEENRCLVPQVHDEMRVKF
jgi:hypothetical protein